jgi:hypothetical protein
MANELYGPAVLGMTQGFSAFSAFLPSMSEIRKAHPDTNPDFAADVRIGEITASAVTVGMGLIVSSLVGSMVPAFIAMLMAAGMVVMHESVLRANNPLEHYILEGNDNA